MIHNPVVRRVALLAASLVFSAAAIARDWAMPAPRQAMVRWSPDFATALATAAQEQRILVICFNMDGEAANERALAMYGSDEFAAAVQGAICVMCSADEHTAEGAPCSRFPGLRCREHRDCERSARTHLFGARRDNIAPQHVVLYPDGIVAWHGVYESEPSTIVRAIRDAEASKQASVAQRVRRQRLMLTQAKRRARNVPATYMQVLATLALTPASAFLEALRVLDGDVPGMVLDDLATYPRPVAEPLLTAATKHPTRALRTQASRLLAAVQARPVAAPAPVDTASARPANSPSEDEVRVPVTITAPLAEVAAADSLGRVYWAGDDVSLTDCHGRVTVLWFFQDNAPDLAAEVARMNEFARVGAANGIQVLGLAVALRPSELVERLGALGCAFPVGAYQATNSLRFFGIERFPAWGVLDPEARLVFRSPQDAATVSRTAALDLATAMAASPAYAGRVRAPSAPTR